MHVRSPQTIEYLPDDHPARNDNRTLEQLDADLENTTKLTVAAQNMTVKHVWESIFPNLIDLQAKGNKISLVDPESS